MCLNVSRFDEYHSIFLRLRIENGMTKWIYIYCKKELSQIYRMEFIFGMFKCCRDKVRFKICHPKFFLLRLVSSTLAIEQKQKKIKYVLLGKLAIQSEISVRMLAANNPLDDNNLRNSLLLFLLLAVTQMSAVSMKL